MRGVIQASHPVSPISCKNFSFKLRQALSVTSEASKIQKMLLVRPSSRFRMTGSSKEFLKSLFVFPNTLGILVVLKVLLCSPIVYSKDTILLSSMPSHFFLLPRFICARDSCTDWLAYEKRGD